jgi:hypothetical protein
MERVAGDVPPCGVGEEGMDAQASREADSRRGPAPMVRRCDSACGRVTRSSRPLEQEPRRRPRGSPASRIAFSPPGLGTTQSTAPPS